MRVCTCVECNAAQCAAFHVPDHAEHVSGVLLQGIGAPACAMLLTRWFAARERGTYWGLWVSC